MKLDLEKISICIIDTLKPLGVRRIALFGSFARGDSHPRDIDILVKLLPENKRKPIGLKWFTLDQELSEKLGLPVDLVSEDSVSPRLKRIIEQGLKIIYEEAG